MARTPGLNVPLQSRLLIPADLIVVALDTNVFRDMCHHLPDWFSGFVEMSQRGYAFCFDDIVVAEVVAAISRGSLTRSQVGQAVERASEFIFSPLPFLPGPRELNVMSGAIPEHSDDALPEVQGHLAALWSLFGNPGLSTIQYDVDGKMFSFTLDMNTSKQVLDEERSGWTKHLDQLREIDRGVLEPDDKVAIALLRQETDKLFQCEPPLSARLDLRIRYVYHRYCQHNRSRDAYDPRSRKRRNDGVDLSLFNALLVPALVVTHDTDFVRTIAGLPSYQANWVMSPQTVVEKHQAGTIPTPEWECVG